MTALATRYCQAMQTALEYEREEFVAEMLNLLPRLYWEFSDIPARRSTGLEDLSDASADGSVGLEEDFGDMPADGSVGLEEDFGDMPADGSVSLEEGEEYYAEYVDEELYESVRRQAETVLGEDDTYLETFEEDMKYSDTPIGASVAEGLADIFQPLYNFISVVKDTDGESLEGAFRVCKEGFESYWAQTLCNVMRPLNAIRYR